MPHFDLLPSVVSDHPNEVTASEEEVPNVARISELLIVNLGRDASHEDVHMIVSFCLYCQSFKTRDNVLDNWYNH